MREDPQSRGNRPGADVERVVSEAHKDGLVIHYIVNTHGHGDHTAGSGRLKALTGAAVIIHSLEAAAVPQADILLSGDQELKVGEITFKVFHTPATRRAASACMPRATSSQAILCSSATAAAPT